MARSKHAFEKDCKELIKALTGIKGDEENFERCHQYAMSNFKYHRFLDVNSHKTKRDIEGMRVKFLIHSQEAAASSFQTLTDKFLATIDIGDNSTGHEDVHYAILSMLLLLSNSPTLGAPMETTVEQPPDEEQGDSFDWGAYLLEGDFTAHRGTITNTLDWSADEDDSDSDLDSQSNDHEKVTNTSLTTHTPSSLTTREATRAVDRDSGVVNTPESLLDEKMAAVAGEIAPQYWTGRTRYRTTDAVTSGGDDASSLSRLWELYLVDNSDTYVTRDRAQLTEHQILREIIWMLLGISQCFIYAWDTDHFIVNKDIQLSHLTDQTLFNILDDLGRYGDIIWKLNQFVDSIAVETTSSSTQQERLYDNGTAGNIECVSQTYQAFGIAISHVLQQFKRELVAMETDICTQEETITVSSLLSRLSPYFARLSILDIVFRNGIEDCLSSSSNDHKASFLLSQIYATLQRCDALGTADTSQVSLLFPIWVVSLKPYLDIIDQWVTTGKLDDPCREFIVRRNADVKLGDENFWEAALTVHDWKLSSSGDQSAGHDDGVTCRDSGVTGVPPGDGGVTGVPSFLAPIMHHVVGAGKAAEMLQLLDGLLQRDDSQPTRSLYEVFIESLQSRLGSHPKEPNDTSTPAGGATSAAVVMTTDTVFVDNVSRQLRVKGVRDAPLAENFSQLLKGSSSANPTSKSTEEQELNSELSQLDWSRLSPVKLLLQTCLYPHISRCYKATSDRLLQILKEKCSLMNYFTTVRSIYLMEAGDIMYDFYTPLFEKLRFHESWRDLSFLNVNLREALQDNFPSDADRLFVAVKQDSETERVRNKELISALQSLTLQYEVPWPINIILNSKCMQIYNEVFSFLLQIKRAKYSLDRLSFEDLERDNPSSRQQPSDNILSAVMSSPLLSREDESSVKLTHRVQLLRMRLMHFVNSLHNYMMTRILHSTGLEFQREMSEAMDLDLVIAMHARYMCRVHERCLLHTKVQFIRDIVTQVLNMALTFADHWNDGVASFSVKFLREMELTLSRCIQFLSSFLNNTIKRGSFPHLETLAFALVTSSEQIRR